MELFIRIHHKESLIAIVILLAFVLIFIQSELIGAVAHDDHGDDQDFCKLVSQTLQNVPNMSYQFDQGTSFLLIQNAHYFSHQEVAGFTMPKNFIQEKPSLFLLTEILLI